MPSKQQQADSEIHVDQLLKFLVNVLTGALALNFGEHADQSECSGRAGA